MADRFYDGPTWYLESGMDDDPDDFDGIEPMSPAEAAVLDTIREDETDAHE